MYCAVLSGVGIGNDFREFIADVESVKEAYETARVVQFKEAKLTSWYERKGTQFTFKAIKEYSKIVLKSAKLAGLCDTMGSGDAFLEFIGRSVVFGIEKSKNELEARLLIGSICRDSRCADEDYVLIVTE